MDEEGVKPSQPKFKQVSDYYVSGMDSAAIEKRSYLPLVCSFERINNIKSVDDIINEIIYEKINGIASPMTGIFVWQDSKNTTKYIPQLGQGGTTLPDRDYYLKNDQLSVTIRSEFISDLQYVHACWQIRS